MKGSKFLKQTDLIPNKLKMLDLGCVLVCELWSCAQPLHWGCSSKFNQVLLKEMQICLPSGIIVFQKPGLAWFPHPGILGMFLGSSW